MADLQRNVGFFWDVTDFGSSHRDQSGSSAVLVALKPEEGSGYPFQGSLVCLKGSLKFLAPRLEN